MSIDLPHLNALDQATFTEQLGAIYEHSPWVADQVWSRRPFDSLETLASAMREAVDAAGYDSKLALLREHPRLGIAANLTTHSQQEQSGAGLMDASAEQRRVLHELNDQYEARFGFPYIIAVKGLSVAQIITDCQSRVGNDTDTEFDTALGQVFRIAEIRLADMIATPV